MRICIITRGDLLPATHGAAVKIVRTATALARAGATVHIVTNDRVWFFRSEGGELVRVRYPQALLSATNLPPGLKQALSARGVPSYWHLLRHLLDRVGYPRDEHFLYQPLFDVDFLARVLYVGWAHQVEVYQADFPGYAAPALLAARLLGGRSFLAEHNVEWLRLAATTGASPAALARMKAIEVELARRVTRVITCSEVDKALLVEAGVPAPRVAVIPHGVDLESYQPLLGRTERALSRQRIRARYRLPVDVPLLVFHGTLHYWPNTVAVKRIAEELLPALTRAGARVKVMICGMNPPRWYAHPDIVYTGMVQDLAEHLCAADLAVVPLEDGGGTRLKILEYFAARLPVVSTEKGAEGLDARDGIELLRVGTSADIAAKVVELLGDPARAEALALGGRRFVEAYSWGEVARRHLQVYQGGEPEPFPLPLGEVQRAGGSSLPSPLPIDPLRAVAGHIPSRVSPTKPLTMILMLNRGCNLRCDFCDLYERPKLFPEEKAERILADAAALGVKTVVFTGGEPFLHPGLFRLIARARALGMGTNVTTNGTLIERHLDKILDSGVDSLSVSLDGLKDTHERLRKIPGSFDQTMAGLTRLRELGHPHVNVYFVITGQNVAELVPVWTLARQMGFGFDFWPVNDAHHLYVVEPTARAAYVTAIDEIAAADPAVAARRDYYLAGLDYHAGWDKRVRCLGLVEQFGVNIDGELVPCCVWDNKDLTVGSLTDDGARPLTEQWYGERARARREEIYHTGCHNRCFNHSLYEFQLATGESFVVGEGAAPPPPPPRPTPPPYLPGSYMVVELANGCNLACVHCAQAEEDHPHYRTRGFFPLEGLRALVADLKQVGARFDTLILFWLGEPLLHPKFGELYSWLIRAMEEGEDGVLRPFSRIEVHTNATLLSAELAESLFNDAPVYQRWHFTLDADTRATYEAIKGADLFDKARANIEQFYALKGRRRAKWPHTAIQYIVSDRNVAEVHPFLSRWERVIHGAGLEVGRTAGHVPDDPSREFLFLRALDCPTPEEQTRQNRVFEHITTELGLHRPASAPPPSGVVAQNLSPCSGFWKTPVISYDGTLTTCTRDNTGENQVGNVLSSPFSELWWGPGRLEGWRQQVARGDYVGRELCKSCFIPQSVNYTDITSDEIRRHDRWSRALPRGQEPAGSHGRAPEASPPGEGP